MLKTKVNASLVACLLMTMVAAAPAEANTNAWRITKDTWSATDERNFSAFITALGESGCNNVDRCLKSPANPYRSTDPQGVKWYADCADWPFMIRAYFAWKNGLPFSYVNRVSSAGGGNDTRYSPNGNKVDRRKDIVQNGNTPLDAVQLLKQFPGDISSAMFRFNPLRDIDNGLFFDFVPVKIDRNEVRSGTIIYDPNGHVALVYKVEDDGRVRFIDAHPDNSLTRGVYGEKFSRASPGMGAGFKNFRPIKLVDASTSPAGELVGGRVITVPNWKNPAFSVEQFIGTDPAADVNTALTEKGVWKRGTFQHNGQALDWYDFVRSRLAVGELKYHPVEEMTNMMDALCQDIKDRVLAVDTAIAANIHQKAQPSALPNNIYGTEGEWETFSTPSRDARLKTSFVELLKRTKEFVELHRQGSSRIDYKGTNLAEDLRQAYARSAQACAIEYKRTDRSTMKLNFTEVSERLFALSFDPYHCPEARWGAKGAEANTCADGQVKRAWYEAEQRLRNQIERTYDVKMGFTLQQLQAKVPGSGVDNPPDVDLRSYLNGL